MANLQDASIGIAKESVYKTGVTPTRWLEFTDESLGWDKTIVQGQGLRAGSDVARSARRVIPTAQGLRRLHGWAISKGMGALWEACLGSKHVHQCVGSTYQQVATFGAPPSYTIQKGTVGPAAPWMR